MKIFIRLFVVQVNLCQKLLFLHQLTQAQYYKRLFMIVDARISASEKDLPAFYHSINILGILGTTWRQ